MKLFQTGEIMPRFIGPPLTETMGAVVLWQVRNSERDAERVCGETSGLIIQWRELPASSIRGVEEARPRTRLTQTCGCLVSVRVGEEEEQ